MKLPDTVADVVALVVARRDELARLHALVDGAALCDELLQLLREVRPVEEPLLTLAEAARRTGYTADHLGRLVRSGALANLGRKHRPLVRLSDCPKRVIRSPAQPARVSTGGDR